MSRPHLIAALLTTVFLIPGAQCQVASKWERIELLGRNNDISATRELAESVLNLSPWVAKSEFKTALVDQLSAAENRHRQQRSDRISEAALVTQVNEICRELGLPKYSKTSQKQIRYLRLSLMFRVPSLIGRDARGEGENISPFMSPVEAVLVALMLAEQKMNNPDYQFEPKEWNQKRYERDLQRWRDARARRARNEPVIASPALEASVEVDKSAELESAIARAIVNLGDQRGSYLKKCLDGLISFGVK